jgi:hypothetical protein
MIKYFDKVGIIISSLVIVVFLYLASIPIPFSDDLCFYFKYNADQNVLSIVIKMYMEKEGRFASLPGIFQIAGFRYLGFNFTTLMWAIFFLMSVYAVILFEKNVTDKKNRIYQGLFLLVLFLVSFEHILNEIVFWPTGGIYSSIILVAILFLLSIEYNIRFWKVLIMSILIASVGPNVTLPIIFILLIKHLVERFIFKKELSYSNIQILLLISILIIGIFFLIKSPGTIRRMNSISTFWMWHPRFIVEVVFKTLFNAFSFYPVSFPLFLLITFLHFKRYFKELNLKNILSKTMILIYEIRYLIGALISVLIFVRTPGVFTERAAAFFMILIIIQFYKSFSQYLSTMTIKLFSLISLFVILVLMSFGSYNYTYKYIEYYQDIKSKEVSNSNFANKHIYTDYHYFFKHYKADEKIPENIWLEQCLKRYRKFKYNL